MMDYIQKNTAVIVLAILFLFVYSTGIHFAHNMESRAYEYASQTATSILGALLLALQIPRGQRNGKEDNAKQNTP